MSKEKHEAWASMFINKELERVTKPNRNKTKIKKLKKKKFKDKEDYGNF